MVRWTQIAAAGLAAAALAGCVSAPADAPAWFNEQNARDPGTYPSLREVPRTTVANTDAAHWEEVEQEVTAAGTAMRASPRAEPAPADQNPAAFINEAREELEQARDAHPQ